MRFDPFDPQTRGNPYAVYSRFRQQDPVNWGAPSSPGYPGTWYLFAYRDIALVLGDERFGVERKRASGGIGAVEPLERTLWQWMGRWMLFRDPPDHARLRSVLKDSFSPAGVKRTQPLIQSALDKLLDGLEGRPRFDVVQDFAYPLPIDVITALMNLDSTMAGEVREYSFSVTRAMDLRSDDSQLQQGEQAVGMLVEYFARLVSERRKRGGDDLLSRLVDASEQGLLSEEEVIANAILLLVAGHETTAHVLSGGVLQLLQHERQRRAFLGDASLDRSAVEEVLRFTSPVQMISRIAREDVVIQGRRIRAGDDVTLVLASANRDEAVFSGPDRFDLMRRPQGQSAFGFGIHFCLGAGLARAETNLALRRFFERFPDIELVDNDIAWDKRIAFRGLVELPVVKGG